MIESLVSDAILFINDADRLEEEGSDEEVEGEVDDEEGSEELGEGEEEPTITSFDDLLSAENYVRVNAIVTSKVDSLSLSLFCLQT